MAGRLFVAAGCVSILWLAGCSSPATGGTACRPGLSAACACSAGEEGTRVCGPDGVFDTCDCTGAGGTGGETVEPRVSCEPVSIDFGDVWRGQEQRREVVCVNTADRPWSLAVGPIGGADAERFAVGPVSTLPVEPSGTWRFEVRVIALGAGPLQAALPLASTSGRPVATIALVANGLTRALVCSPARLDFGDVYPGGSKSGQLVCTNGGAVPIRITDVALAAWSDERFQWRPNEAPLLVPAREGDDDGKAVIEVSVHPLVDDAGYGLRGQLELYTDEPSAPRIDVPLIANGPGPRIACSPAAIDFGTAAAGIPVTRAFVCTNTGTDDPDRLDDALVVTAVHAIDPTEFAVAIRGGPRPEGYRIGETFTADVTYAPVDDGADAASVHFTSNAHNANDRPYEVQVTGYGRVLPACDLEVAPQALRFGLVQANRAATLEVGLRNRLPAGECLVWNLRLAGSCDAAFSLPAGELPLEILPPGGDLRVPVQFRPTRNGLSVACDLLFDVSAPADPHRVVPIHGAAQESCVSLVPVEVDFGVVRPGCSARDREVQIVNGCPAPIALSVDSNEGPSDEFAVRSSPPPGAMLAPGASTTFTVAYRPGDEGADLGSVFVSIPGEVEPHLVTLRGRAALDGLQTDSFEQLDHPKVDVLWVLDNSGSADAPQYQVGGNMAAFLSFAETQQIDYQVGITTTGLSNPCGNPGGAGGAEDGRLFPVDNSRPRIMKATTPNLEAVWAANFRVGTCHYDEQGMEAAYRALTPPVIDHCDDPRHAEPNDGNCGFLRPDAHLSIIVAMDENDQSPGSVDFYWAAFQALKGFGNPHLFNFHAITGERVTGCTANGGSMAGDKLIDLAERTEGGMFGSWCLGNWDPMVRELSVAAFGFKACFFLANRPEDRNGDGLILDSDGELVVRLNGVVVPSGSSGSRLWEYHPDRNAVCFNPLAVPEPGTQLDITYRAACLP